MWSIADQPSWLTTMIFSVRGGPNNQVNAQGLVFGMNVDYLPNSSFLPVSFHFTWISCVFLQENGFLIWFCLYSIVRILRTVACHHTRFVISEVRHRRKFGTSRFVKSQHYSTCFFFFVLSNVHRFSRSGFTLIQFKGFLVFRCGLIDLKF